MNKRLVIFVVLGLLAVCAAFFLITTTMSGPEPVTLFAPKSEGTVVEAPSPHALVLWLLPGEKIYAYTGKDYATGNKYDYSELKKLLVREKQKTGDSLAIIIKKTAFASYRNTVDVLDQMTINGIKKYILSEPSKEEEKLVEILNQNN